MMATTQRKGLPYLYVTWLAKHLAGESQCVWSLWFQSRFKFEAVETDFDKAAWSKEHDALVAKRSELLTGSGYTVSTENDNYFQIKGETSIIAGKMDLVTRKDAYAIVLDGKTGQKRKSDWWQALIYMAVLPIRWHRPNMRISGEVFYKDGTSIRIEPEELTADLKTQIFTLARFIGSRGEPPAKSPSPMECKFCKIGKNDCPQRIDSMESAVTETSLF